MKRRLRLAFVGLPLAALLLDTDGHELVLAGLRKGLTQGERRLRRRIGSDRVVIDPQRDWASFTKRLHAEAPDLLVSWFFTRKIPMPACRACRLGGIGVHPSLLPRHRGPDPYFAALDAGDTVSGVTVHRIEEHYDTGAIVGQERVAIEPSWNAWNLARALDRPSLRCLRAAVNRAAEGDPLEGEPQDEALATAADAPDEDAQVLRWTWEAEQIVRRVRALAPNPGALAWIGDQELVVLRACVDDRIPPALAPGEATVIDHTAVVRAADTGVALLRAQLDEQVLGPSEIALVVARASHPLLT